MIDKDLAGFVVTLIEQLSGAGTLTAVWPETLEYLEQMGYDEAEATAKFRVIYEAAGLEYPE